ncbi:RDD family protein [Dyadobacter psychrotolerans]|uniref:RDD family protein n=1 Tax=Dyadobacter psychrotolerans TaxID=2541721 RepID=A0A4R5DA65_9BACT|nr:cytochrome c oxidase assembly factor Coa1 family protein [Dyadobacter psychrotolerans]TDE10522.1 RDD family protein [Dyadobacter psychrotolerans]
MNTILASRKRRVAAFLIDHFVITSIMVSATFLALGQDLMNRAGMEKFPLILLAVTLPGFLLYFGKDSFSGISPGKWIMGIMVRDAENKQQTPSAGRLFLRNLLLVIWPVEVLILATNDDKKRLGDKVAKTIVVQNPDKPTKQPRILALLVLIISFFAFTLLFTANVMKSSDAYKAAIREIEKNEEIRTETGGIKGYGFIPTGSINIINGHGQAQLGIKVLGNDQNVSVNVQLKKEPEGEWKLIDLQK